MRGAHQRGFSLLELIIVIVIIGVIAAIAIPRMSSASERSVAAALGADIARVQHAIELYSAEHLENSPAVDPDGSVNPDGRVFIHRMMGRTDDSGNIGLGGVYGPYLRAWPDNPYSKLSTVRIGGDPAGANTDGWRFDPDSRAFESDYGNGKVSVAPGGGAVAGGGGALATTGP